MNILICVDDTDDITKETSTGKIADLIARAIEAEGAKLIKGITRHQLLLHDDIDYTSHNSSMCMEMEVSPEAEAAGLNLERMKSLAEEALKGDMSKAADPGLCFVIMDKLRDPDRLIAFGRRAQKEVLTKEEAYQTASEIGGTVLQEYGGTGIGIIGALAGCGLRLSGNDGTIRGGKNIDFANSDLTVAELKQKMGIEQVVHFDGHMLSDDTVVGIGEKLKLAYLDHKVTLVARENKKGQLKACKKKDLYEGNNKYISWQKPCDLFEEDNDLGECYSEGEKACWNCLYRRWTSTGYLCVKSQENK